MQVGSRGLPHLAKNERDMGHPLIRGRDRNWTGKCSPRLFSPYLKPLYLFGLQPPGSRSTTPVIFEMLRRTAGRRMGPSGPYLITGESAIEVNPSRKHRNMSAR